jgi:DNA gyrase subunit A
MHQNGLTAGSRYRKSATVVGDVLGNFHPHGDTAVYDSMVRMAQDFSMRYQLVDGQGNFGSIDGDSAAAYRYTEARMKKISEELLADIEKETVDFRDNYNGEKKEPVVLPAKLPQLLLNGTVGIAVGMATNIPPHNLCELVDGTVHLLENPEATIDDLCQFIKGPDFPTGGIIYNQDEIKAMYVNGRGGIAMRARAEIEEWKGERFKIVITEIPYQVNKADLVLKIANLVRDKKIIGISDLRDESNREGIRVVIELKKEAFPKKILNQLFQLTPLQTSFNMNMIALVEGVQPRLLNLKQVLEYFIIHRKDVITRRTRYDLRIAQARAHILEGLRIALDHIDEVIATIRASATKEDAQQALIEKFGLSDLQSKAILEMRLQTLAGLERKKIDDEYLEKMKLIAELEAILADEKKVIAIIKEELLEARNLHGDERRTEIVPHGVKKISSKDTIPNEAMMVMLTRENYLKRVPLKTFRAQHRGGKGIIGAATKEEDEIKLIRYCCNHDNLLFFTNKGRVFQLPAYEVQLASRTAKGQPAVNLLNLEDKELVTAILNQGDGEGFDSQYLFMATNRGTVKKTEVGEFKNLRRNGLIAIKLRDGDSLEWVKTVNDGDHIFMVTKKGLSIRYDLDEIRPIGRPSMGVRGIKLKEGDEVVEMDKVKPDENADLLVVMENGLGKSTAIANYRIQGRGGTGLKTANITTKTGCVIGAKIMRKDEDAELIMISKNGQIIRLNATDIPSQGRATQGVYLMRLNKGDLVAAISLFLGSEIPETPGSNSPETEEEEPSEIQEALEI